jgi:hypothetical protein
MPNRKTALKNQIWFQIMFADHFSGNVRQLER